MIPICMDTDLLGRHALSSACGDCFPRHDNRERG